MSQNTNPSRLNFFQLTSLVTGNLIGSGVFMLPAALAAFGSISLLGWLVTTIGAIILALIFSELAHKVPKAGGPYAFTHKAFGDHVGFFTAWGYWILGWISNAALLVGAVGSLMVIFGDFDFITLVSVELFILMAVTLFNLFDLQTTGTGGSILTLAKVIPLIALPVIGFFFIDFANFQEFNTSGQPFLPALNAVAFITLWGFVGLETGTVPGDRVINPRKNIPLATITGTLIAAAIYILGTIMVFGVIPQEALIHSKAPYAEAAAAIFGGAWGKPVAFLAFISCIGALNGWTMVVGRIPEAASHDGLFPKAFSWTNKYKTPYFSVLISAFFTAPLILWTVDLNLLKQFNFIIDISVTFLLVIYTACVLAMFKIFSKSKELDAYRITIGSLGLLFLGWALWAASLYMVLLSFGLVLLGLPLWIYNCYTHKE